MSDVTITENRTLVDVTITEGESDPIAVSIIYAAGGGGGGSTPVIDNLASTSATSALSANQGRVLDEGKAAIDHNHDGEYDPDGSAATAQAAAIQRSNHTGTQAHTTITGLGTIATFAGDQNLRTTDPATFTNVTAANLSSNGAVNGYQSTLEANLVAGGSVTAAQFKYDANAFVTESTTARTLTIADHGKTILCTNASAVSIDVVSGLPDYFWCSVIQLGTGTVTLTDGSSSTDLFTAGSLATSAQYGGLSVANYGTTDTYLVS